MNEPYQCRDLVIDNNLKAGHKPHANKCGATHPSETIEGQMSDKMIICLPSKMDTLTIRADYFGFGNNRITVYAREVWLCPNYENEPYPSCFEFRNKG